MKMIEMNRRFLRSVNLGSDRNVKNGLAGYVITPSVRRALARIQAAFTEKVTERAFTLTGPYGTGKSSFGLFLWHLLSDRRDAAWKMFETVDPDLATSFRAAVWPRATRRGCLVLPLTAHGAPVAQLLAEAFSESDLEYTPEMKADIESLRTCRDSKAAMKLVRANVARLCASGYSGVFFVFDEFGKVFEEARREGGKTDVFLLQELAEAASRSSDERMYFLGMLHQSFADYAEAETTLHNEFQKIEGRFEPISFIEPIAAQISLAAASFPADNPYAKNPVAKQVIKGPIKDIHLASLVGLKDQEFAEYASRVAPLHPMTLAAMPLLFRRFGQNERSIFSFLTSNESKGFQDFLMHAGDGALFRLCDLFDYFLENFEAQLSRHTFGQPFMEAHAAIEAKASLSEKDVVILKTLAVLTSLGLQSPIRANEEMIAASIAPTSLAGELAELRSQSILVYRKFNQTYALWNGSDVDLHECCETADAELAAEHFSVAETFSKFLPPMPIVAKRHTVEKGSLRYFDVVYADDPKTLDKIVAPRKTNAAGTIVVCLSSHPSVASRFETSAKTYAHTLRDKTLLFAVPSDISELTEALREVRRLNWVEANVPELRDDRIARREVAVRLAAATQSVTQHQSGILDPRPASQGGGGCRYFWNGTLQKLESPRDVSRLLSDVCDDLYSLAPIIKNELVNKRAPSSQAAAARRIVINALINPEAVKKERLCIEGFPPERSVYESVIALSGIHRSQDGVLGVFPPDPTSITNLLPVWNRLEELVFSSTGGVLVVKDLFAELAKPPYGVLEGVAPILFTAFYACNKDELSLYYDGTFVPVPQEAQFELLVRRPDLFSVSGLRVSGIRKNIIQRLANSLKTEPKVLSVVRYLYAMMGQLTKYAEETDAVSGYAQNFRQAFLTARSPEHLLFVDLPQALGLSEVSEIETDDNLFHMFFERMNACIQELSRALPNLIDECRKLLLRECGLDESEMGWKELYDKSAFLLARIGGSDICPFLQNVVNTNGDWNRADQVMSYIQQMPISKWSHSHIDDFKKNVRGFGERFKSAYEPYAFVQGALSENEMKQKSKVVKEIKKQFSGLKVEIVRAAILDYLKELEG